jgi:hypothetical protein
MDSEDKRDVYACGNGHLFIAWVKGPDGEYTRADLIGYFCPICMGHIVGHEDMIDNRILAPAQE